MTSVSLNHGTFVVTGGGSGIGAACLQALLARGASVICLDMKPDERLALPADQRHRYRFVPLDVRDPAGWSTVKKEITDRHGPIDGMINNAGIYRDEHVEDISLENFRSVIAVNLEGTLSGCKMAVELMKGRGGSIVNVSSVLAVRPRAAAIAYGASKAGVDALTRSVAHHCKVKNYRIRCNSVCFGTVDTPMSAAAFSKGGADLKTADAAVDNIHRRAATPEEAAEPILFLLSESSKFITGTTVVVDGGRLL